MTKAMDRAYVAAIRKEYEALKADETVMHNRDLHQHVLQTWKRNSPKMWWRLTKANLTNALAYVLQERMWQETDRLLRAGLPMTDAREIAEREHLMLEPEEPESAPRPNSLAEVEQAMADARELVSEVRSRRRQNQ